MTNPTPPGQVPDALRFTKRPVTIEAIQWTGKNLREVTTYSPEAALRAQQDDAYDHGPQAETVEEAARDVGKWLNERPGRPLDLRHVAMLTHHAKRAQQAGWKCAPVEPTDAMVQAAHHIDLSYMPGQEGADRAAIYRAMLAAAPAGATPECLTCNDHGAVGNILTAEPCPDCTRWNAQPAPAAFVDEDHVTVPRSLIGAACSAIDKKQDAPKTLEELRRYTVGDLSAAPQPFPTAQAASSAVLKAIRKANMQLVRTGDNAFMLVPYKVATAQAAESVPAVDERAAFEANWCERNHPVPLNSRLRDDGRYGDHLIQSEWEAWQASAARAPAESVQDMQSVNDAVTIELPPLPDPDLRDVGTRPQEIKEFLNGYATEYARLALAACAPAESVGAGCDTVRAFP